MRLQLPINVVTYNGELLEKPRLMYFDCDLVRYVGIYNARTYDANDCIVVRKAFGFLYGNDLWQTFDFKTVEEFIEYRDTHCLNAEVCCLVTYQGCNISYQGLNIVYSA